MYEGLPDKLPESSLVSLFLERIRRTRRVMLAKAPGCISAIRLFDMFTDNSLGWVARTSGLSLSEKKRIVKMQICIYLSSWENDIVLGKIENLCNCSNFFMNMQR